MLEFGAMNARFEPPRVSLKPRSVPPYMHKIGRGLFTQVKTKDGGYYITPLDTANPEIATARMVPVLKRLVRAGQFDRDSRVCRLYLPGRCPKCGRPFPGTR
jgi:hypothetical protein